MARTYNVLKFEVGANGTAIDTNGWGKVAIFNHNSNALSPVTVTVTGGATSASGSTLDIGLVDDDGETIASDALAEGKWGYYIGNLRYLFVSAAAIVVLSEPRME